MYDLPPTCHLSFVERKGTRRPWERVPARPLTVVYRVYSAIVHDITRRK